MYPPIETQNTTGEASAEMEHSTNSHVSDERKPDESEEAPEAKESKSGSEVIVKKKKPSKNQRRKYKQAQLIAGLSKAHGDEEMSKPYESPAFWPSLPIWPQIQLRLWIARSDLAPEVATVAERLVLYTICKQLFPVLNCTMRLFGFASPVHLMLYELYMIKPVFGSVHFTFICRFSFIAIFAYIADKRAF